MTEKILQKVIVSKLLYLELLFDVKITCEKNYIHITMDKIIVMKICIFSSKDNLCIRLLSIINEDTMTLFKNDENYSSEQLVIITSHYDLDKLFRIEKSVLNNIINN